MKQTHDRSRSLGELLKRELSRIIQREVSDKHIGMVTVTTVKASPDLRNAKIYVTFINETQSTAACVETLNQLVPFIRTHLAHDVNLRVTPQLKFYFDETLSRANRVLDMMNQT